ncbi:MAG: D-glycero-beta-D-manno-heptose 1-phosphate adenylyltransferase [Bacteroidetes bacterium]|jgi:D-beta-D-heptose 7-phosphate kinase/D-beta-D-heptose 1-phosphate adenosyltransferase|nr:D-glycero-beta-D-manno-heptose 1-phosphate adenylyltransferase [Bacteroidota bacterium]HQW46874.1 D-glycero-beta-D-manno-heptose 1-phosphate adenylyltransferase [Chitinophagaceae bacterium]MBK6819729.1 D-glycero-beta-D-manno-heptose 1-phosphate adenylyltransferase [Bacteroidota bacterium]MBK7587390.1 D-glycero-beta-D-manno-heptose 1-phosphate adenylyltransferase [Bacteroidota bacterium]MBK8329851.1 D-glycero-beta-D-manno-heptose 1-phosphate adenylyltransferase [Bacteroidota bacterium]
MLNKLEIIQQKIYTPVTLSRLVHQWHMLSKKIVFTNGCFDIMHQGHNTYLLQAADYGNKLIVAVNSDASVQKLKGSKRPIIDQYSRALNLASHAYIDAVIIFDEDTPLQLIQDIKPHVLVKGGDYTEETIVGASEVKANGGEVIIIPFLTGYSSSAIIDKIVND